MLGLVFMWILCWHHSDLAPASKSTPRRRHCGDLHAIYAADAACFPP